MAQNAMIAIFLLCLAVFARVASSKVVILTADTLEAFVLDHTFSTVIWGYGIPCAGCHQPPGQAQLERIAEAVATAKGASLGVINCAQQEQYCKDNRLATYPTFRHYHRRLKAYAEWASNYTAQNIISAAASNRTYKIPISAIVAPPLPTKFHSAITTTPSSPSSLTAPKNEVYVEDDGRKASVKLELPGLPLFPIRDTSHVPTVALFHFSMDNARQGLLLNGRPLALGAADPVHPMRLEAEQKLASWSFGEARLNRIAERLRVDYALDTHSSNTHIVKHVNEHREFDLDIIAATTIFGSAQDTRPMNSSSQKMIHVSLVANNASSGPADWSETFRIDSVELVDRPINYIPPGRQDGVCRPWSWLCADLDGPQWYKYVWSERFDKRGRIGCLRRTTLIVWSVVGHSGFWAIPVLLLWLFLALFFAFKVVVGMWRHWQIHYAHSDKGQYEA